MRKQVLQRMRGSEDIEEEFEAIKLNYWEVEQEQLNKSTNKYLLKHLWSDYVKYPCFRSSVRIVASFTANAANSSCSSRTHRRLQFADDSAACRNQHSDVSTKHPHIITAMPLRDVNT